MSSTPSEPQKPVPAAATFEITPLSSAPPVHDEHTAEELKEALSEGEKIDTSSFYILGDPKVDRDRLIAQAGILSGFVRNNAKRLIRNSPKSILDVGCGEGQMSLALSRVFPGAHIIGIDLDVNGIQRANERRLRTPGIKPDNIEFSVGNVQENLPPGPFDLIYASAVLLHLGDAEKTLRMIFERLRPGGVLWIRELGGKNDTSQHPVQKRWMEMMTDTMAKMGRRFYIAQDLPEILPRLGFTNLRETREPYNLEETTITGRIMMSVSLAGIYNTLPILEKFQKGTREELVALYKDLTAELQKTPMLVNFPNFIVEKPADASAQSSTETSDK